MTNKWDSAPEGAKVYAGGVFWVGADDRAYMSNQPTISLHPDDLTFFPDFEERPAALKVVDWAALALIRPLVSVNNTEGDEDRRVLNSFFPNKPQLCFMDADAVFWNHCRLVPHQFIPYPEGARLIVRLRQAGIEFDHWVLNMMDLDTRQLCIYNIRPADGYTYDLGGE